MLLIGLFYILKLIKKLKKTNPQKDVLLKTKVRWVFIAIVILLALSALLSYIWVFYISDSSYVGHREGLNDVSNRMRFVSILKGFSLIGQDSRMAFWGLGDGIYDALGLSSSMGNVAYLGVRLVQPHNSLLSIVVKMGIIPALFYFICLSGIVGRFVRHENIEYIIPYALNAMLMHSFFERGWLVMWVFVLMTPEMDKGWSFMGHVIRYKLRVKKNRNRDVVNRT